MQEVEDEVEVQMVIQQVELDELEVEELVETIQEHQHQQLVLADYEAEGEDEHMMDEIKQEQTEEAELL